MLHWQTYPKKHSLLCLLWSFMFAVLSVGPEPVQAAKASLLELRTSPPAGLTPALRKYRVKPRRQPHRATQTTPNRIKPVFINPKGRGTWTGGKGRGTITRPGSSGVLIPRPPTPPSVVFPKPRPRPRPRPPTFRFPTKPPKYVAPRPRPGKGNTARRTPKYKAPPKRIQPPVLATIPQFLPNEILVFVKSDRADAAGNELAAAFNLTKLETVPLALLEGSLIRFRYSGNRPLRDVLALLKSDPRVTQAQPNNWYHPVGAKSRKRGPSVQYALAKMAIGPAHAISKGRDIFVAIIDTGIDAKHPALANSIASSFDAVGDGKRAVNKHGTAIAGLVAGQGRVKGIAPLAKVMAVRAFYMHREYNKPMTSSIILLRALDWSFKNKARIFNMSFTGPYDPLVRTALANAYKQGVILVAAAGNGGPKAAPAYPAAYRNVIAITALDNKNRLYAHANRGSYLTAAAPGVDVLVPSLNKGYRYSSGTSLAAAHISGLIALLLEQNPGATAETIVDTIKKNARDLGPKGYDTQFGAGLADAYASLISLSNSQ